MQPALQIKFEIKESSHPSLESFSITVGSKSISSWRLFLLSPSGKSDRVSSGE